MKHVELYEHRCVALEPGPTKFFLEPEGNDGLKQTVKVHAVHQDEGEDRQSQIESHMKLNTKTPSERRMAGDKISRLTPGSKNIATSSFE